MKLSGYYSSGEFARMANVSVRTIRFYDKQNILKPSYVKESGARFYTDADFARLQQILLLKYLGFSLDDIREMTIGDADYHYMLNSLKAQLKLVQDKIEQMQLVEKAIVETAREIEKKHELDGSRMLHLIHLTNMEKSLKTQYQDATNLSARIHLHSLYSANKEGWFPWIFRECRLREGQRVLELGCGDGALWRENFQKIPRQIEIVLSDVSKGMVRDARRALGGDDPRFSFETFDCRSIPHEDRSFDLVIAGHLLFYCEDIGRVCREARRVLKDGGIFLCSTYGARHMQEISRLVQEFDSRILLSAQKLYERFGLENGEETLRPFFEEVQEKRYDDYLLIDSPQPLMDYILSCHGNQNRYLLERYKEFRSYVEKKTKKGFLVTKDAGIFLCRKKDLNMT